MFFLSESFLQASQQPFQQPIILFKIQSTMGYRVYAFHTPTWAQMGANDLIIYNGETAIGQPVQFGKNNIPLDYGARLLQLGDLTEALAPDQNILGNFHANELTDLTSTLNNADRHFSKILCTESFLNQHSSVHFGFHTLDFIYFLTLFSGRITTESLTATTLELTMQNDTN